MTAVTARPQPSPSHRYRPSSKPKGLPVLGEQVTALPGSPSLEAGDRTPYRLPRISARREGRWGEGGPEGEEGQGGGMNTWSRHGYQVQNGSPEDMLTTRSLSSPRLASYSQMAELRRLQYTASPASPYPHFRQAMITPVKEPRYYAGSVADPAFYRNVSLFSADVRLRPNTVQDGYYPAPTPVAPTETPSPVPPKSARSSKSIHWALTPYKNHGYDKKGIKGAQGPYSREFTRTCMAPNNWLKMKWGRQKSAPV